MTPQITSSSLLVQSVDGSAEPRIVPPAEVAAELNQRFPMEDQGNLYFMMVYGVLDLETREFRFVCAGHPNVLHVPAEGQPQLVDVDGMAIGWVEDVELDEHTLQLEPGDRLYLYSDGVPEAMDAELSEFGDDRMIEVISKSNSWQLDDTVNALLEAVQQWCIQNGPKDDVSILGVELAGE